MEEIVIILHYLIFHAVPHEVVIAIKNASQSFGVVGEVLEMRRTSDGHKKGRNFPEIGPRSKEDPTGYPDLKTILPAYPTLEGESVITGAPRKRPFPPLDPVKVILGSFGRLEKSFSRGDIPTGPHALPCSPTPFPSLQPTPFPAAPQPHAVPAAPPTPVPAAPRPSLQPHARPCSPTPVPAPHARPCSPTPVPASPTPVPAAPRPSLQPHARPCSPTPFPAAPRPSLQPHAGPFHLKNARASARPFLPTDDLNSNRVSGAHGLLAFPGRGERRGWASARSLALGTAAGHRWPLLGT
nr:vegetative cell wall protein gp1-like [Penaeus vannamei]